MLPPSRAKLWTYPAPTGSVNVLVPTNIAKATVEANAKINRNSHWHDHTKNPHPNQAAQQGDLKGEEVVSVEATNYLQTIDMTGIFALPGLEIDPTDKSKNKLIKPSAGTAAREPRPFWAGVLLCPPV